MNLERHVERFPELIAAARPFTGASAAERAKAMALFADEPSQGAARMTQIRPPAALELALAPLRAGRRRQAPFSVFKGSVTANDHSFGRPELCRFEYLFYQSHAADSNGSLLLIVPPIQGLTVLERSLAAHSARRGAHALIALPWTNPTAQDRSTSHLAPMQIRTIKGLKHLVDLAPSLPGVNADRIVAAGASLGGNSVALALGVEPRIKGAVTLAAGGNFPDLLADSQQSLARRYREARTRAEGLGDREGYRQQVAKSMLVDSLLFAANRDRRDLFMIMAAQDKAVPFANQVQLWEAFGRPDYAVLNRGHAAAIMRAPLFYQTARDFFLRRLSQATPMTNGVPS